MKNWYTIGIIFLAGLAAGLLGFLFIQPAQTGSTGQDRSVEDPVSDSSEQVTDTSETTSTTDTAKESDTTTNSAEENQASEPSESEEWEANAETSTTPELIFYYKPGWPLCQSTKDIVDDLKPNYVGDVDITYIPMRSEEGIRGRKKYNIRFGMVLLDSNREVFWKEEALKFSRSKVKSQLDSLINEHDS